MSPNRFIVSKKIVLESNYKACLKNDALCMLCDLNYRSVQKKPIRQAYLKQNTHGNTNIKFMCLLAKILKNKRVSLMLCISAELARKFGLSPEKFGENLRDNYQRHDVEQDPAEPLELAEEFVNG